MSRNLHRGASRRLARVGEPAVVRNYTRSGTTDEYGDEERVERTDSPHETRAVVEKGTPDTNRDAAATRPANTYTVLLAATSDATANLAGGPADAPRSTVEAAGRTLGVLDYNEQANGLVECEAEVIA